MTLGSYDSENRRSVTSENSLDIRNDSLPNYKEAQTGRLGPEESGHAFNGVEELVANTALLAKNLKRDATSTMSSTPTELNDFLAMLDDKSTYSQVMHSTGGDTGAGYAEPLGGHGEMQVSPNTMETVGIGSPEGSYPNSTKISNHSSSDNTLDLSPNVGVSMSSIQPHTPLRVSNSENQAVARGGSVSSTSMQDFLHQFDLSHSHDQYINPYLLNKEASNGSLFMDNGTNTDSQAELGGLNDNPLLLDDVNLSPQPILDDRRRMSEVANANPMNMTHSRGSISHQIDFWNLNNKGSLSNALKSQQHSHEQQQQQPFHQDPQQHIDNNYNGESFDLMSFKKNGKYHQQQRPHSSFKIDNELTQLLDAYNMTQPSVTNSNKTRAGSFTHSNAKRSNSSTQDPHNRVAKQRYSMSLLDGNQDLISKLYGDMTRNGISWENAIMSDEEEDEVDHLSRQSALTSTGKTASQHTTDPSSSSRFISPQLLNNEPLLERQIPTGRNSVGIDRASLNFEISLPISDSDSTDPNTHTHSHPAATLSASNTSTSFSQPNTRRKRSSISKPKTAKSTSPLDGDEKPFKCDQCTKAFRRSEHLKRHVRSVHSTERPFHCQFCDKKFSRSDNLSQHLKTHKKHGDITELPPPRRATHSSQ